MIELADGDQALNQLGSIRRHVDAVHGSDLLEIKLLLPHSLHDFAGRFVKLLDDRKQQELEVDPLAPFFRHPPTVKIFILGHVGAPGSDGFPTNAAGCKLTHFFNSNNT